MGKTFIFSVLRIIKIVAVRSYLERGSSTDCKETFHRRKKDGLVKITAGTNIDSP